MPIVVIRTKNGASGEEIALSERVFGAPRNVSLMHQAVRAELENSRQDTRNAPGRGDMLGGGKKPFRQKGTGRSRQGSTVAPHWRHGGAAHGPHPRDLSHALPKKMKRQAIRAALSAKLADGELIVVDAIPTGNAPSTKTAAVFLAGVVPAKKMLVIVEEHTELVWKSLRNIAGVTVRVAPQFSTRDVIDGGIVVITRAAAEKIDATWNDKAEAVDTLGDKIEEPPPSENSLAGTPETPKKRRGVKGVEFRWYDGKTLEAPAALGGARDFPVNVSVGGSHRMIPVMRSGLYGIKEWEGQSVVIRLPDGSCHVGVLPTWGADRAVVVLEETYPAVVARRGELVAVNADGNGVMVVGRQERAGRGVTDVAFWYAGGARKAAFPPTKVEGATAPHELTPARGTANAPQFLYIGERGRFPVSLRLPPAGVPYRVSFRVGEFGECRAEVRLEDAAANLLVGYLARQLWPEAAVLARLLLEREKGTGLFYRVAAATTLLAVPDATADGLSKQTAIDLEEYGRTRGGAVDALLLAARLYDRAGDAELAARALVTWAGRFRDDPTAALPVFRSNLRMAYRLLSAHLKAASADARAELEVCHRELRPFLNAEVGAGPFLVLCGIDPVDSRTAGRLDENEPPTEFSALRVEPITIPSDMGQEEA